VTRPLVIVNPQAGGGLAGRTITGILQVLERAVGPCDLARTERAGHAVALARDAKARSLIVAVGGDGTLNEVANGVLEAGARETRVGYIGQGTGGDFRRTLGIDHRLDRYVEAIASGRTRAIDVGRVTYGEGERESRYFVNIVSAGLSGLVDRYVASGSRRFGGAAAYAMAGARALADARRGRLRCVITRDGSREERLVDAYLLAVCNGRTFGSGMHVAPMAAIDDGLLDVVTIDGASKLAFALTARKLYDGSHVDDAAVTHSTCTSITLTLENEDARDVFLLDLDGEPLGPLPATISLLPAALTLCA